ncbi:DUF294 nucleotidyltransferase-like domain-containing protein [Aurantiacibacter sediminis]|uniref:Cyclic nucleotide-binding/CBS domain-containing protein n=1 Tax=Aurantiacibacter sediminis TaxID=2793064 RepID=A0ABS0N1X1_9SPHN|nr:DUF294 nucleotidyltransferase-like domain-containing protein [Aurantiacibacter sediminis]MBH5321958.1 cyclic nucleotide-binding/CBS domain-containing protein [Aurantiacibacter sediminis]
MAQEIAEIARFLRKSPPFDLLGSDELARISRRITVTYHRAGDELLTAGKTNDRLLIVRSGAVELRLAGDELTARLGVGSAFAYPSILRGGEVRNTTIALEDTLIYALPGAEFLRLRDENPRFREHFTEDESDRIRHALRRREEERQGGFDTVRVDTLMRRAKPVTCAPTASIRDAAQIMHQADVSTLAVCDGADLVGILSDKDLRNRVVAPGLPFGETVLTVMTPEPRTLNTHDSVAEAMALMASGGFRHVPLLDENGSLAGMISSSDILAHLGHNAIDAGLAIARAETAEALIAAARRIPDSFVRMVRQGLSPRHVMRFVSALGEATHRRAAELAEAELGDPPVPYALVVFGSLAREEQLVGSDQDNGLVIADELEAEGEAYFAALGTRLSDLLDECGFVYCKGGIMAKNAEQRLTATGWRRRYEDWIDRPDEDRILRATIFFDMRCVHGEAKLVDELRADVILLASQSSIFGSYLARDAQRSKVPLGIFRNLVLEDAADGSKVFDVKAQAIMPIIDVARTLALSSGSVAVGTAERLQAIAGEGRMASGDAQSLIDAMTLVSELRIRHQAEQVAAGNAPDNAIAPSTLSPLERDHLKDAFGVIRGALDSLRRNLAGGIA